MLNAQDAEAAYKALLHPSKAKKEDRAALRVAYSVAVAKITAEFCDWLVSEYASSLPVTVQNRIWSKAWEDGHSSGYNDVETHFIDYAEFAEFVFNAK